MYAWTLWQVYKALSHGVQPVAVKVFPLTANAEQHAEFQREVVLLKSCRDGNIVQVPAVPRPASFVGAFLVRPAKERGVAVATRLSTADGHDAVNDRGFGLGY